MKPVLLLIGRSIEVDEMTNFVGDTDFKVDLAKSWAVMLFKFQWQIEKHCPQLGVGPGLVSMSPLAKLKNCTIEDNILK